MTKQKFLNCADKNEKRAIKFITEQENEQYQCHYQFVALNVNDASKTAVFRSNAEDVLSNLNKDYLNEEYNRYMCINPLKTSVVSDKDFYDKIEIGFSTSGYSTGKTPHSRIQKRMARCEKNIFCLKAICVRIIWPEEDYKDNIQYFLNNYDYILGDAPKPNIINAIYNEVELIYGIEELSKDLLWKYNLVGKVLSQVINKQIDMNGISLGFPEVDKESVKCDSLIRVPGTYDAINFETPTLLFINKNKTTVHDLYNTLHPLYFIKNNDRLHDIVNYEDSDSKSSNKLNLPSYLQDNLINRIEFLNNFAKDAVPKYVDKLDFAYYAYNTLRAAYDDETAKKEMLKLTNKTSEPLSIDELELFTFKDFNNVNNVNWCKFKTTTFIKGLGLDPLTARREYGLKNLEGYRMEEKLKKKEQVERNKKRREFKYNKIVELYAMGKTYKEIMKELHVSSNVISRKLTEDADRLEQIKNNIKEVNKRKIVSATRRNPIVDKQKLVKKYKEKLDTIKKYANKYRILKKKIKEFILNSSFFNLFEKIYYQDKKWGLWKDDVDDIIFKLNACGFMNKHRLSYNDVSIALNANYRLVFDL